MDDCNFREGANTSRDRQGADTSRVGRFRINRKAIDGGSCPLPDGRGSLSGGSCPLPDGRGSLSASIRVWLGLGE